MCKVYSDNINVKAISHTSSNDNDVVVSKTFITAHTGYVHILLRACRVNKSMRKKPVWCSMPLWTLVKTFDKTRMGKWRGWNWISGKINKMQTIAVQIHVEWKEDILNRVRRDLWLLFCVCRETMKTNGSATAVRTAKALPIFMVQKKQ